MLQSRSIRAASRWLAMISVLLVVIPASATEQAVPVAYGCEIVGTGSPFPWTGLGVVSASRPTNYVTGDFDGDGYADVLETSNQYMTLRASSVLQGAFRWSYLGN